MRTDMITGGAACALFVALAWALATPPAPTFSLVAYDHQGDAYVLDTGLTAEDCASSAPLALADDMEAIDCEAEG